MDSPPGRPTTRQPGLVAVWAPYLALVACHLLTGLQMEQPLILADEAGYLGIARYFSGTGHLPDMRGSQLYHFGYSLFLVPAFWLSSDPLAIYKLAMVLNALLASSLYFPLRFLLVSVARVPEPSGRWIAFACCLYPPLMLHPNFAWSEAAYVPLYALTVALLARLLESGSTRAALALGLAAGFLYAVHPRGLPVAVVTVLFLLALAALRAAPPLRLLAGVALTGAVLLATRLVNAHLQAKGWFGGGNDLVSKLPGRLAPGGSDLTALLERASGQLLYLSQATLGLFVLGLVALIWLVVRNLRPGPHRRSPRSLAGLGVPLFVLATGFSVLVGSSAAKIYSLHGVNGLRGGNFIHGRYNEAFAVVCIAVAVAALHHRRRATRQIVVGALIVIAATLALSVVVMTEVEDALVRQAATTPGEQPAPVVLPSRVDTVAVAGIYPLVARIGSLDLYAISLVALSCFVAIVLAMRFSMRLGLVLLMVVFATFTYDNFERYLEPLKTRSRPRLELARDIRELGPIPAISYDRAYRRGGLRTGLQYLLPDTVFDRFDSSLGETPESAVVISGDDWGQAEALEATFVAKLRGRSIGLWVLPGGLRTGVHDRSFEGVSLGARFVAGVRESGFHRPETFGEIPGRWTDETATLGIPVDIASPPRAFTLDTMVPGRPGPRLQVRANGTVLWDDPIPPHASSMTLGLEGVELGDELVIELRSETFSPAETIPGSTDERRLGVVVTGLRLRAENDETG